MKHGQLLAVGALSLTLAGAAVGQNAATVAPPEVGAMAPDFSVPGATRYGLITNGVRLSDFRGETVVLSFIVRARTRG